MGRPRSIEEDVALSRFTTIGTGGPARFFARPESLGELEELLRWARDDSHIVETIGLGGFQETDQLPVFSKITKYQAHVAKHPRMAELLARCFDMAASERGPTQFNIPRDNFYGEADYEILKPKKILRGPGADESLDEAAAKASAGLKIVIKDQTPLPRLKELVAKEARGKGRIALVAQSEEREVEAWLAGGYALSPAMIGTLRNLPGVVEVQEI